MESFLLHSLTMINKLLISSFIAGSSFLSLGQSCDKVLFTGKVIDSAQTQSFYNLMLVNRRTGQGVFGQPNGTFSIYVNNGDTVALSVKNYLLIKTVVVADSNCQYKHTYYLERKFSELPEVSVRPLKSLEQIKEERQELALRETRTVTGVDIFQSPITALYQTFSKKEQNKRWIAEQEYHDDQRRIVKELLRNYVAYDIIDLTEEQFDQFISFLNINEDFLKTATEMELITFIQDKYEHFKLTADLQTMDGFKWRSMLDSDKRAAIHELLTMYVTNKAFDLPSSEFDRFIGFMNLDQVFLVNASDADVFNYVRAKYIEYIDFYHIDVRALKSGYSLTEADNEDWQWDLKHKNKKAATVTLLRLYNTHKVIQLPEDEFDKFITFMNLKESFMLSATNDELIQFVREKYYNYLSFYKK
ncbi:MAG: hypothetical protein RLZ33_755 [Bacteroidota bacterium]